MYCMFHSFKCVLSMSHFHDGVLLTGAYTRIERVDKEKTRYHGVFGQFLVLSHFPSLPSFSIHSLVSFFLPGSLFFFRPDPSGRAVGGGGALY